MVACTFFIRITLVVFTRWSGVAAQNTTCTGNAQSAHDVICPPGQTLVLNAALVFAATQAECCACPAGTTSAYNDESLAFRFRADGLSYVEDGTVVWNAEEPAGLAFTQVKPVGTHGESWAHFPVNHTRVPLSLSIDTRPDLVAGVHFNNPDDQHIMFANRRLVFGGQNTFFAVVTPMEGLGTQSAILGFRPGENVGTIAFQIHHTVGPPVQLAGGGYPMMVDNFGYSGYVGPSVRLNATQILIYRTRLRRNKDGEVSAASDMAVLSAENPQASPQLEWLGMLLNAGLDDNYNIGYSTTSGTTPLGQPQPVVEYDYDYRAPIDGTRAFGAGYMLLGSWYEQFPTFGGFGGVIHAIELHSATLSERQVLDVVERLISATDPSAQIRSCHPCAVGQFDHDSNASTVCEPCGVGRFSNEVGALECSGTCPLGSTVLSAGATTSSNCTDCDVGKYGATQPDLQTSICSTCPVGTFSTETRAFSSSTCRPCANGQFSVEGASACHRSGCMDEWAANYDPHAVVDEGACIYECPALLARANMSAATGQCLINGLDGRWQRFSATGVQVIEDFPVEEAGTGLDSLSLQFSGLDLTAVAIQGRPLPGHMADVPQLALLPWGLHLWVSDDETQLACRYIHFGPRTWITQDTGGRMLMHQAIVPDNPGTGNGCGVGIWGGSVDLSFVIVRDNGPGCEQGAGIWTQADLNVDHGRFAHNAGVSYSNIESSICTACAAPISAATLGYIISASALVMRNHVGADVNVSCR